MRWPLGGLVISKHNTIRDVLFELAEEAFGKSRVGNEPTIYPPGLRGTNTRMRMASAEMSP